MREEKKRAEKLAELDFGACIWCGATREVDIGGIHAKHPPESCCIEAMVWQLAWRYRDPEYSKTVPAMMRKLKGALDAEGLTGAMRKKRLIDALANIRRQYPGSRMIIDGIGAILKRGAEAT